MSKETPVRLPLAAPFVALNRTFKAFTGTPVLVTFIYTKCPMPAFCPLMDQHFVVLYSIDEKLALWSDPAIGCFKRPWRCRPITKRNRGLISTWPGSRMRPEIASRRKRTTALFSQSKVRPTL